MIHTLTLLFVCAGAQVAHPVPTKRHKPRAHEQPSQPASTPAASDAKALDFDLLAPPVSSALDPRAAARFDRLVHMRRVMLQLHTFVGMALLVATTANVVLGTLNYYDRFGGGGYTNHYDLAHEVAAYTTFGLFTTNLVLGLAAPNPFERKIAADRLLVHRIFMFVAAAGFIAETILGIVSTSHYGANSEPSWALAHLGLGYATSACVYAGAAVFIF